MVDGSLKQENKDGTYEILRIKNVKLPFYSVSDVLGKTMMPLPYWVAYNCPLPNTSSIKTEIPILWNFRLFISMTHLVRVGKMHVTLQNPMQMD